MAIADAVTAAVQTVQTATSAPAPATGTPAPAAAPSPAPAKTEPEPAPTLFFHRKENKEAVDLDTLDPTKLPPELLSIYKSMQADYTKKRQVDSDFRKQLDAEKAAVAETRKMLDEFLSKVAQGRTETPAPDAAPNVMEEIKLLRENGDHEAADRKLMEFWNEQQKAATEPLRKDAELKNLQATFRDTATKTMMNDPIVQQYGDYVQKVFDADTPQMNRLRQDILSSPERVKFYTPIVMRFLGYEAHIQNLENTLATKVDSLVAERIKSERAKALGLPQKLVSSGATSQAGERPRMGLEESIRAAVETLTSG